MEDIEETSRRRNGGKVFHKAYNQHTIHLLKKLIFRVYNQGLRKFYCILVDGEMVVRRTSDARKFDGHKAYVDHTTEQVEVRLFIGKSFNANRYIFQTQTELSGTPQDVDVDLEISKALDAQKLQMELESLQRQVEKKDKKVRKLKSEKWRSSMAGCSYASRICIGPHQGRNPHATNFSTDENERTRPNGQLYFIL